MEKIKQLVNIAQSKWRDNFWIIVPAFMIFCFLIFTTGLKSFLNVMTMETQQLFVHHIVGTGIELHVEYPLRVSFNTQQAPTLRIWAICVSPAQTCPSTLQISSLNHDLQFAIENDNLRWKPILKISRPPDGSVVSVRVASTNNQATVDTAIKILMPGAAKNVFLPNTRFEGARDAKIRLWGAEFLGTGSLIVSVIAAIFAGIKQLNDEKRREIREIIQQALDQFEIDLKNTSILDFLRKWDSLQKDWPDWSRRHQGEFRKKFENFLKADFLLQISKELKEIEEIITTAKKIRQSASNEQNEVLDLFEKNLKFLNKPGKFVENNIEVAADIIQFLVFLVQINPKATELVSAIVEQIPEAARKTAFDEIAKTASALPLSSRQLKDMFGFPTDGMLYSPEEYPLARRFDIISSIASQLEPGGVFEIWLQKQGLKTSPFFDVKSPYTYRVETQIDLRDTLVGFFHDQYKPGQNKFVFQNDWDLRACFYDYCRSLSKERKTFFVLLSPALLNGYENTGPKETILHALAHEWLYTLVLDNFSFFELNATMREALCRLLAWHCGSVLLLKMTIEEINRSYGKITYKEMESLLEIISQMLKNYTSIESLLTIEINTLLGLRPANTTNTNILYPSIDLDHQSFPTTFAKQNSKDLDVIAGWLKTALGTQIIYFVSADSKHGVHLSEEDLAKLCNSRLLACSDKKIEGFDQLFSPHVNEPAELILARKANGSPGKMIRLGQTLLLNHYQNHPDEELLDIQELLDLNA